MLKIEHEERESCDFVKLIGRLGAADGSDAAEEMVGIFERGPGVLQLDLSELEWVDSGGLSALVKVLKLARSQDGDLILINPNERVRAILEMTRLHEIFEIRDEEYPEISQDKKASGFE